MQEQTDARLFNDIVYFGNLLRAMTVPKWSIVANAKPLMGSLVPLSHFAHSEHLEEVEYFAHTQNTFQVWRVTKKMKLLKSLKTRITATNLPYESVKCAFSKGQFKEKVGVKEKQQLVTN